MLNLTIPLTENSEATLTTYVLDPVLEEEGKRAAVVIFPGGGYAKVSPREGEPIACAFMRAGYHAFVVKYRVHPYGYPDPVLDGLKALSIIIEHAEEWRIDLSRVFFYGGSAGGHLATVMALYHTNPAYLPNLPKPLIKPKGLILSYPVITSGEYAHQGSFNNLIRNHPELRDQFSLEKHIHPAFPPTFVWHTVSDVVVPVENTLYLINALRKNNISFEAHLYPHGVHGLSLANEIVARDETYIVPHVQGWIDLCIEWMKELK